MLFTVASILLGALSCSNDNNNKCSGSNCKISVTDFRGKQIGFNDHPKRIVCLIESALSGFYMLHTESSIVGVSSNIYDSEVFSQYAVLDNRIRNKLLPTPGNWDFISMENIVALKPDLVVMWASQTESIETIEAKGIPVYAVMLTSTADVYKEISDFGKITGTEKRADSLIQYTKSQVSDFSSSVNNTSVEKQKVYFMWSQGPLETSGAKSTVNELIELAGANNACISPDEHMVVNLEKLIEWNPDVIVMWCNANKNPVDILNLSGWENINAVKNKRVYELPSVFMCDLWTLKFQYAVKLLHTWCYPSSNSNVNLDNEKTAMLKMLYGSKGETIR
ncbi:MAG: ABC transporter substrate-binding protein [Bacteroidales bacterium]